jgi:transposase
MVVATIVEPSMQAVTTIGLDIAKSVFQVHGIDATGNVVIRRQLKRRYVLAFFQKLPPCVVGIEACATSHHWSRELKALGHTVRLMPPVYVKPYVKRQKNDAADAEAICEAVTRMNMRFVATKTPEQQSCLMLHRTRHLFIRQQTSVINAIRAHLAEFGIVARVGRNGVEDLLNVVADSSDRRLPEVARGCLAALGVQLRMLKAQILEFDRRIMAWHRSNETSKRLDEIPGVGPALATALVASVADPKAFRSARNFSAWVGLVPKQYSSGGQGQARQYQQTRRPLSAQPVHGWRARRHPLCQDPRYQASALAHSVAGSAADQGRRDRTGKQDRQNGVGDDGQG